MSFKLSSELLARAPLQQAARNQQRVREWKLNSGDQSEDQLEHLFTGRAESPTIRVNPLSSFEILNSDDNDEQDDDDNNDEQNDDTVQPEACLKRLSSAHYKMTDLFNDQPEKLLDGDEPLELLVSPSGVRAVKLVEIVM